MLKDHPVPEQHILQYVTDTEGLVPLSRICEGCSCTVVGLVSDTSTKALKPTNPPRGWLQKRRHRHGKQLWKRRRRISGQHGLAHRLAELGFCSGAKVRVVVSRQSGPIMVEVRDSRLALDAQVAGQIFVRPNYLSER